MLNLFRENLVTRITPISHGKSVMVKVPRVTAHLFRALSITFNVN